VQPRLSQVKSFHLTVASLTSGRELPETLNVLLDQVLGCLSVDAAALELFAVGSDRPPSITTRGIRSQRCVAFWETPITVNGKAVGRLQLYHRTFLSPEPVWFQIAEMLAAQVAITVVNSRLGDEIERSRQELASSTEQTLEGWVRAVDLRDHETKGHSERVTALTLLLARKMGCTDEELVQIRRGALLHDIGKIAIPDEILLKPCKLSDEDWKVMRLHPFYAYEFLLPIPHLRSALDIPYCHHEKWDGSGYPQGLKGTEIPLMARIFAIVDVWDALISDRPYRPAWKPAVALEHIRRGLGTHFDPEIVPVFFEMLEETTGLF
jgi:response regulator RpfG family c-di-GMP phosphodiesterase